jgi:hypothetical protein
MQAAHSSHSESQSYICAAAGHIRGDGNPPSASSLSHNLGFFPMPHRVEQTELEPAGSESLGQLFTGRDAARADKQGAAGLVQLLDIGHDCLPFGQRISKDSVGQDLAQTRFVCWDGDDWQTVDLPELGRCFVGSACHASQAVEKPKETLETQPRQCLGWISDSQAFFGLDGLMQASPPGALVHQAASEFINNDHFAIDEGVLLAEVVELARHQGLTRQLKPAVYSPQQGRQIVTLGNDLLPPAFIEFDFAVTENDLVIYAWLEGNHHLIG